MNYDLDNNGVLDYSEASLYLKSRCPHIPEDKMKETFDSMDLDKNGYVDKEEMFVYVKKLMNLHHLKNNGKN